MYIYLERFYKFYYSWPGELFNARDKTNYTIIIHYLQPIRCEFNIFIVVSSKQLIFSPSIEDFKNILCYILNEICEGVRFFKKLETELYLDWSGEEGFLEVWNLHYIILRYITHSNIITVLKLFFSMYIHVAIHREIYDRGTREQDHWFDRSREMHSRKVIVKIAKVTIDFYWIYVIHNFYIIYIIKFITDTNICTASMSII